MRSTFGHSWLYRSQRASASIIHCQNEPSSKRSFQNLKRPRPSSLRWVFQVGAFAALFLNSVTGEPSWAAQTNQEAAWGLLVVDAVQGRVAVLDQGTKLLWEIAIPEPVDGWITTKGTLWISDRSGRLHGYRPGRFRPSWEIEVGGTPRFVATGENLLITLGDSGRILRFDPESRSVHDHDNHLGKFQDMLETPTRDLIFSRPSERALDLHSRKGWSKRLHLECTPTSMAQSLDGPVLIGGRDPAQLLAWEPSSQSPRRLPIWFGDSPITALASDGIRHAVGTEDGTLILYGWTLRMIARIHGFRKIQTLRWLRGERSRYLFGVPHRQSPLRDRAYRSQFIAAIRRDLTFESLAHWGRAIPESYPYALPAIQTWRNDVWLFQEQTKALSEAWLENAKLPNKLGDVKDHLIGPSLINTEESQEDPSLLSALSELHAEYGHEWTSFERRDWQGRIQGIPHSIDRIMATAVVGMAQIYRETEAAFFRLSPKEKGDLEWGLQDKSVPPSTISASATIDFVLLRTASRRLLALGERLKTSLESLVEDERRVKTRYFDTPIGRVILGGGLQDKFQGQALILIDVGGDDYYGDGIGGATPDQHASLLIDVNGDDVYEAHADWAQGAADRGVSLSMDLSGNDSYKAESFAQGVGLFGHGALIDFGGEDRYEASQWAQGVGLFGSGLLVDAGSTQDFYRIQDVGQGTGAAGGLGALVDLAGNDNFEAIGSKGFTQGAGMALDWPSSNAPLGGIGFFVDGEGNDRHVTRSHSLGYADANSIGIYSDLEGNDKYSAQDFGLGTARGYGLAAFVDREGDDTYDAQNRALGYGEEFGLGWFVDWAGTDVYRFMGFGMGRASNQGGGFFLDLGGDDLDRETMRRPPPRSSDDTECWLEVYVDLPETNAK